MRALDTNVLARYVMADDPRQLLLAERVIQKCRQDAEPIFLPVIVICELIWVLDRSYQQAKADILNVLDIIIEADAFEIEHRDLVRRSVQAYRQGKGNFADYLISEISLHAGCRDDVSFDRALKGISGFTVLS